MGKWRRGAYCSKSAWIMENGKDDERYDCVVLLLCADKTTTAYSFTSRSVTVMAILTRLL